MDWILCSDHFSETRDRQYRISRAVVGGKAVYAAWKRILRYEGCLLAGDQNSKYVYMPLCCTDSLSEARAACEKDVMDGRDLAED